METSTNLLNMKTISHACRPWAEGKLGVVDRRPRFPRHKREKLVEELEEHRHQGDRSVFHYSGGLTLLLNEVHKMNRLDFLVSYWPSVH